MAHFRSQPLSCLAAAGCGGAAALRDACRALPAALLAHARATMQLPGLMKATRCVTAKHTLRERGLHIAAARHCSMLVAHICCAAYLTLA